MWFSEIESPPRGPWLTFHTHAVVEAFVVEAPVVGRAEVLPQATAGPCRHSEHTRSATLSGPAPRAGALGPPGPEIHHPRGRAVPWWGGAIWCAGLPAGTTDGCHGPGPCGRVTETPAAPDGQLIDRGRGGGGAGSPPWKSGQDG